VSEPDTPWERWSRDPRPLQHLSEDELSRAFIAYLERTVTNDRLVPIEGVLYELPRDAGRGGQKVLIAHRLIEGTYHVVLGERLVRLHPVDLAANARSPRAQPASTDETKAPPTKTAADLDFERDLGAVLDQDGGALPPSHAPDDEEDVT
jgi:hypothetical protein